jgi:hypothetical protein
MRIQQSNVSLDRLFEYYDQQVAAAEAAESKAPLVRVNEPDPMHDMVLEVQQVYGWLMHNLIAVPPQRWNEEQGELFNELLELQERFNA